MKVTVLVSPPAQEVEVSISAEDITAAFAEHPESVRQALLGINSVAQFLKAITPEMIAEMTCPQRELVKGFLVEQAKRYEAQ